MSVVCQSVVGEAPCEMTWTTHTSQAAVFSQARAQTVGVVDSQTVSSSSRHRDYSPIRHAIKFYASSTHFSFQSRVTPTHRLVSILEYIELENLPYLRYEHPAGFKPFIDFSIRQYPFSLPIQNPHRTFKS